MQPSRVRTTSAGTHVPNTAAGAPRSNNHHTVHQPLFTGTLCIHQSNATGNALDATQRMMI